MALVCLLLPATPASAATIAYVQGGYAAPQTPQTTVNVTFTIPQTAGNLNVIAVGWNDSVATVVSVTDRSGNTYTRAVGPTIINGTASQSIYVAKNIVGAAAGANMVTVTFSRAAEYPDIRILEYSGLDRVNPVDVTAAASGNSATSNSGAVTTTNANDLLFGANLVQTLTTGPGSGYTRRLLTIPDGDIAEDRVVTAVGSYSATAPVSPPGRWIMQLVALRAASGDTTPPAAPSNLTATVNAGQVTLSWTAATDDVAVTGYRVERCSGTNCSSFAQIATPSGTTYADSNPAPGPSSYRVRAADAAGNLGPYSNTATATVPDTTPPTAPSSLTATASGSQIALSWGAATDNVAVVGYQVERCSGTGCSSFAQVATPTGTAYSDPGLATGSYSYRVRAADAAGNAGAYSNVATATVQGGPPDTTPPSVSISTPTAGATVSGVLTVTATASDDVGVTGVQFAVDGVDTGAPVTTSPYTIQWDTTAATNAAHALTATARDAAGHATTSAPVSVTVSNTGPPPGLAAAYAFDETTGTTAADGSGHGVSGTLTNGPTWVGGRYGNAVNLDGNDDFVDSGNRTDLQLTGSMTISGWINSASFPADDAAIVSKRQTGEVGYQLDTTIDRGPRTIGFKLTNSSGGPMFRYGATAMQLNTWYHVAGVYNATTSTLNVYLNGQLDNGSLVGTITSAQQNSTANVAIGRRASGGYNFAGRIDNVRVYSRALTQAEIQTDMTTPVGSAGSSDPIPPTVSITAPQAGAQVSDIVNVTATAQDNVGVVGVQFFVDGTAIGQQDGTSPYGVAWDTRTVSNGAHTVTAVAGDAAGNTTTSTGVSVNVANTNFFQNEVLATNLSLPTSLEFLPDGRMLVTELQGRIRVLPPPYTQPDATPFLQITNIGSAGVQQGIYDIALDPGFATNRFYYVFYTAGSPNRDRLSRFTANAPLTGTVAGSELVLYQDPQDANAEHHGGAVNFGNDGKIYFTTGEHFNAGDAQRLTSPRGKIHRINSDGTIPTDNPFFDGSGPNVDSIWALGLRNPFRAYYDAPSGRLFVGDVGGNDYSTAKEEMNIGAAGANYGWPNVEGACSAPCTSPIYFYPHNGRDAAITGGFVYHGSQFPSSYVGSYFFADYTQNWIKRLTFDASGNVSGVFNFEPADGTVDGPYGDIVYLAEGPDGALYYVDLGYSDIGGTFGISKIRRIRYVQSNQPPTANASANPTSGPVPLTVAFSSAGSVDPEGQPLTYSWTFGDNTTSTQANPSHTYAQAGQYSARLAVSDGTSTTNSLPITISVGNRPTATILSPQDASQFRAGDVISYSGTGTDTEDGTLPASAFTWNIDFLHEGHVHPGVPVTGVKSGTFTIPTTGHDFSGNTRYRITLTVTDANGLSDTKAAIIWPTKVNLGFDTVPGGLTVFLDDVAKVAPFVYDTLIGFNHSIDARSQTQGTTSYTFGSWSDGGAAQHTIVVPSTAQNYVATFTAVQTPPPPIAFVQVNSATPQSPQQVVSLPYPQAQTAGATNILAIGWNDTTSSISSATDSAGNVYRLAAPTIRGSGVSQAIYYASNIAAAGAGSNVVTVQFDRAAMYVDIRALEYRGLDPTAPLDATASASGSGGTANSGAVSTSAANELIFGAGTTSGAFSQAGPSYTVRAITQPDLDIAQDRIVTSTGSYAATAPVTGQWVMQVATFKGAGP